jgi:hypothetical protein
MALYRCGMMHKNLPAENGGQVEAVKPKLEPLFT